MSHRPEVPRRGRPRPWAVLSVLGAIALTALWVVATARLFDETTFMTEGAGGVYVAHVAVVVVGAGLLWRWWRELLQPDVHRERAPEPPEPAGPHRSLAGEDPPPKRW